jgi:hypothetical protein
LGKQSLFIARTVRDTQIHYVGRIYSNSVRISQETHYVSGTKPNRLMLLGKQSLFIVRTIRNTQIHCVDRIYSNSVRTSQETRYVSATKPNRLMLFRETVAVYCENHTEHINTLYGQVMYNNNYWPSTGLEDSTCTPEMTFITNSIKN